MLTSFALRLIAQQALLDKTWAGSNVLNSPLDPLASLVDIDANWQPAICIFSGASVTEPQGKDLTGEPGWHDVTIQIYVPPGAIVTAADGSTTMEVGGKGTLATFVLDMMETQVRNALLDPRSPWADLWSNFVTSVKDYKTSPPFLEVDDGLRVPAKMLEISVQPLSDPTPGRPLRNSWLTLYTLMMEQPTLAPLAELMKQAIENPSELPDWARLIMSMGLSNLSAINVGIKPLDADFTLAAGQLDQIGAYDTVVVDDPSRVIVPDPNETAP